MLRVPTILFAEPQASLKAIFRTRFSLYKMLTLKKLKAVLKTSFRLQVQEPGVSQMTIESSCLRLLACICRWLETGGGLDLRPEDQSEAPTAPFDGKRCTSTDRGC